MSANETVKILLVKRAMTITELAKRLTDLSGKKYTQQSLSKKILRDTLRFCEIEQIAKILGYKIEFKEI